LKISPSTRPRDAGSVAVQSIWILEQEIDAWR
jgi:hypothetical protein